MPTLRWTNTSPACFPTMGPGGDGCLNSQSRGGPDAASREATRRTPDPAHACEPPNVRLASKQSFRVDGDVGHLISSPRRSAGALGWRHRGTAEAVAAPRGIPSPGSRDQGSLPWLSWLRLNRLATPWPSCTQATCVSWRCAPPDSITSNLQVAALPRLAVVRVPEYPPRCRGARLRVAFGTRAEVPFWRATLGSSWFQTSRLFATSILMHLPGLHEPPRARMVSGTGLRARLCATRTCWSQKRRRGETR